MSPVISNNASGSSNPVQSLRAVEQRARSDRTSAGTASPEAFGATAPSAIVKINPAARERAQAEGAAGAATSPSDSQTEGSRDNRVAARASRPAGSPTATNGNRLPTNVSAALRAYGTTQPNAPATPTTRSQDTRENRSTAASNDPTGVTNSDRTKPTRAGTQQTAEAAEQAQVRQQRDQAANLQGAAANTTRLANQSARIG